MFKLWKKMKKSVTLKIHEKKCQKSSEGDSIHSCVHCGKSFCRKDLYLKHLKSHTKGKNKISKEDFSCDVCLKVYKTKKSIFRHKNGAVVSFGTQDMVSLKTMSLYKKKQLNVNFVVLRSAINGK